MRSDRKPNEDLAVSEVIGVVMLLAMVITMMGGVFLFLTPYVNDFQDNTAWSNANGIAERLDGRIDSTPGGLPATAKCYLFVSIISSIRVHRYGRFWHSYAECSRVSNIKKYASEYYRHVDAPITLEACLGVQKHVRAANEFICFLLQRILSSRKIRRRRSL